MHRGHSSSSSTIFVAFRWQLSVEQRAKPLYPPIANDFHVTKQSALCVRDALGAAEYIRLELYPLEVHVETGLVAISDARLKLTDEFLEESPRP